MKAKRNNNNEKWYVFNKEITKEVKKYIVEIEKIVKKDTARGNGNYVGMHLEWLKEEGINKFEVRYKDIIRYVNYLKAKHNRIQFINTILLAIDHYYGYLGVAKNPVSGIRLKGIIKSVPSNIVEYAEIEEVYNQYQGLDYRTKRNRVMLGLLVYQALRTGEFEKLEPHHIRLKEGKIYIPGKINSNARILNLEAAQLLELQDYLMVVRPQLQRNVKNIKRGRSPKKINYAAVDNQLFFSEKGLGTLTDSLKHIFTIVRRMHPKITSGEVIRYSIITEWLKKHGLRQVQYMAGHIKVSSTERYKNYNLEELKESLNELHPLQLNTKSYVFDQ